jgi:hypothetical protein
MTKQKNTKPIDHFKKSSISFLKQDCISLFGKEMGERIYKNSTELLEELLASADFRNSKTVEKHMRVNIMPGIAFYRAMLANKIEKEQAYQYVYDAFQKAAQKISDMFSLFKVIPCFFSFFRWVTKKKMASGFSKEVDTVWKCDNDDEISLEFYSCVYMEILTQYNCPELCKVHCDADSPSMKGLEPKVYFVRAQGQTIGHGADYCEFRYLNGRKVQS